MGVSHSVTAAAKKYPNLGITTYFSYSTWLKLKFQPKLYTTVCLRSRLRYTEPPHDLVTRAAIDI